MSIFNRLWQISKVITLAYCWGSQCIAQSLDGVVVSAYGNELNALNACGQEVSQANDFHISLNNNCTEWVEVSSKERITLHTHNGYEYQEPGTFENTVGTGFFYKIIMSKNVRGNVQTLFLEFERELNTSDYSLQSQNVEDHCQISRKYAQVLICSLGQGEEYFTLHSRVSLKHQD